MKKRWLVLGLAALMSVGTFVACDKDDDKGDGAGNGAGTVTSEQWAAEMSSLDLNKIIIDLHQVEKTQAGNLHSDWTCKTVINGNCIYQYDDNTYIDVSDDEVEWNRRLDERWLTEINGVSYEYDKDCHYDYTTNKWGDWEVNGWEEAYNASEFSDFKYNATMSMQSMDLYLKMGLPAYTYNQEKDVYTLEVSTNGIAMSMEVKFVNNELYSIAINQATNVQVEGELYAVTMEIKYTFAEQAITLPDQAGLNAAVAAGQLGE